MILVQEFSNISIRFVSRDRRFLYNFDTQYHTMEMWQVCVFYIRLWTTFVNHTSALISPCLPFPWVDAKSP